ncbi:unnamed protein product [Camellia sinensis]
MEESNDKGLERVVSQKALQMGSSFPCQICVVGFLSGVCLTTLFLAAFTSFDTSQFGGISFSSGITSWNSSSDTITNMVTNGDCNLKLKETERVMYSHGSFDHEIDERVSSLYSAWTALLNNPTNSEGELLQGVGPSRLNVPKAPHLENCKLSAQLNERLDKHVENESFPLWTTWKGFLDTYPFSNDAQLKFYRRQAISEGAYPPWITGSDEENYPYTRKVQRDIWVHQHPVNCSDPNVRFLVADWERLPGFGIGAQIAGMCGLLAIAINEKRVLVTNYYNRADHDGCRDMNRNLKESMIGGRNIPAGTQHRRGLSLTGMSRDADENLDLFSRNRRSLSVASSDESDVLVKLGKLSVGSAKLAKSGMDDLLSSAEGGKHDYDWLLTPPGTPLFPSLNGSESQPLSAAPRSSSTVRSVSTTKASRLLVSQSENNHHSRPIRSSSVTRPSISSTQYSTYSNKSTSVNRSASRPSTPTRQNSAPSLPSAAATSLSCFKCSSFWQWKPAYRQ